MNGIVKNYSHRRGFGFITPLVGHPGKTADVFFHAASVKGLRRGEEPAIPAGAEVRFDLVRGADGPQAANLEVVKLSGDLLGEAREAR